MSQFLLLAILPSIIQAQIQMNSISSLLSSTISPSPVFTFSLPTNGFGFSSKPVNSTLSFDFDQFKTPSNSTKLTFPSGSTWNPKFPSLDPQKNPWIQDMAKVELFSEKIESLREVYAKGLPPITNPRPLYTKAFEMNSFASLPIRTFGNLDMVAAGLKLGPPGGSYREIVLNRK